MIRVFVRRVPKALPRGIQTVAQLQHTVAWSLLCDVLQKEYGLCVSPQQFSRTETGKPYLADGTVQFSLTHTPFLAAVAVGEVEVGIDAEPEQRKISQAVRDRFLQSCPAELAVAAWTAREAYGKMTGVGVTDQTAQSPCVLQTLFAYRHAITVCARAGEIARDVISY